MPKPVDEDRARRRAELEKKRAARKAAKEQELTITGAATTTTGAGSSSTTISTAHEQEDTANKGSTNHNNYRLLQLPEDALQVLMTMLSSDELRQVLLTSDSLYQCFLNKRTTLLYARLQTRSSSSSSSRLHICEDESQAQQLLQQILTESNESSSLSSSLHLSTGKHKKKKNQNNNDNHTTTTTLFTKDDEDFLAYLRFVEDASGYAELSHTQQHHSSSSTSIFLPSHSQGRFASASPEHSLCRVRANGDVLGCASWGIGMRGQLGHGKRQDERLPKKLQLSMLLDAKLSIVQVSAGGGLARVAHSLLLTSHGRVLSFGTGQNGALGHGFSAGKQLPDVLRPQYVEALKSICCVCVAAGELHSAVVSSDGDVYTWGDGFCGQLGHADKRPQPSPKQVTRGGLEDECVAMITCGGRHTIAVTEDGDVFSWGLGHFGCLGRSFTPFDYDADAAVVAFAGEDAIAARPILVERLPAELEEQEEQLIQEQLERNFAQELRVHLELLANMTLDDSSDQCIPQQVESLNGLKIVSATAGHRHSLFLEDSGSLYTCGSGNSGCLGHGDAVSQMVPMKVTAFQEEGARIIQMSAGVDMSMAVDDRGQVYAWGKMDGGRIGLGLERKAVTIPRKVTVKDASGSIVKACDVECGYVHSLIVGLDGALHLCGGVGIEGEDDGQAEDVSMSSSSVGKPRLIPNFNVWHKVVDAQEEVKKERWSKYGKYTVKGRSKMLRGDD